MAVSWAKNMKVYSYVLDGVTYDPITYPMDVVERVPTFTFDPSDILIAGYQKSGKGLETICNYIRRTP